jgi:hypothetical protein
MPVSSTSRCSPSLVPERSAPPSAERPEPGDLSMPCAATSPIGRELCRSAKAAAAR